MNTRKTYSILFSLLLLSLTSHAFIVTDTIYRNKPEKENLKSRIFVPPLILKTSPTAFLGGGILPFTSEYRIMAEITTGKRSAEEVSISVLGVNIFLKAFEKTITGPHRYIFKVSGWRIQYAHKFYLEGKRRYAPYGFYFGPLLSYANARVSVGLSRYYNNVYYDFRKFDANLIAGVQVGKMNRVTLDIYAGGGYKNNRVFYHTKTFKYLPMDTSDFGDFFSSHVSLVCGINLGYSF